MAKRTVYDHGLPFSEKLAENLDDQVKRIKGNKASMVIIDGGVGEGKTTLAVHVADYINRKFGYDEEISFDKQLALGGEQFQEKLRICYDSKLPVLVYDEAGDFNKRGALTSFNRQLNRIFETYRAFKVIVVLVLPSFYVLDNSLFEKQIPRLLLHCQNRSLKYGNFRAYSLYRMFFIREKMRQFTVKPHAFKHTQDNFRGHFLDLPPKRRNALDKMSMEGKLDIVNENILENKGLVSYGDLAKALNRSKTWVRYKVSDLGIEAETTYKRKKYFNGEIKERLEELKG